MSFLARLKKLGLDLGLVQEKMDNELLARQLQEEDDREAAEHLEENEPSHLCLGNESDKFSLLSPVDPSLELSDPNPDIRILFLQFNNDYFGGRLSGIEVKWSPRMTLCAGICVYEGFGGLCSVRLSLPLLKLRPRKDLVETLLHEMIHAYLFITNNDRDRDGHGPNFQRHMHRINNATGADITIYHTFHDEVAAYQQHWWRCNGPCQQCRPFFGYVKRVMNRAPSSRDSWWADHKASCGGTFTKIKEPENYGKKKPDGKKNQEKKGGKDIRTFMDKEQTSSPPENKKLFDITGKAPSFDKRNPVRGVSIFSKGKTKNTTSVKNKTSSTSNYVLAGGVLVRKPSLTQSSLFASVGTSNSKDSSHSVLTPKESITTSVPTQKKIEVHNNSSIIERSEEKHKYADIFHGSGSKNHKWLSHKQSSPLPDQNKKNVKLPKNFRSVCDGSGKRKGEKRKGRKKYILDELNEDDGLWDTDSDQFHCKSNAVERTESTDIQLSSVSPLNKKLKDTCKLSSSPKVKRDILTDLVSEKLDNQISSEGHQSKSYTSSKSESNFPEQGYRLGGDGQHAKSATITKTKSKTRALQNTGSSNTHKTLDSFISKEKKVLHDPKRSFEKAFASTIIDISDDDEGEDFIQQTNKRIKEEVKEEVITQELTDNENSIFSASISDEFEQTASFGRNENSGLIPCPVCNARVFHYGINNHLDMCLGMT